jgi:hypothetical protein
LTKPIPFAPISFTQSRVPPVVAAVREEGLADPVISIRSAVTIIIDGAHFFAPSANRGSSSAD